MKLLVISDLEHYRRDGRMVCPWAAPLREVEVLTKVASEVRLVACLHGRPAPPNASHSTAVETTWLRPVGGPHWVDKLKVVAETPGYVREVRTQLDWADAVYLRAPSSIALAAMGLLALRRRPSLRWVRYAGEWFDRPSQSASYRLQKKILRTGRIRALVGVSDPQPGEPEWVRLQPNPSLDRGDWEEAGRVSAAKQPGEPWRLMFSGRLALAKGPERAIGTLARLVARGVDARLEFAGDGPQRGELEELAGVLGVVERTRFHGWVEGTALNRLYACAHFILLPSESEGWPKVFSEAMAHRVIPLGSRVGGIPAMLAHHGCGAAIEVGDERRWADEVERLGRCWPVQAERSRMAARELCFDSFERFARGVLGVEAAEYEAAGP
jgi:glycosyltransferase involved in cell wall biosynthesis